MHVRRSQYHQARIMFEEQRFKEMRVETLLVFQGIHHSELGPDAQIEGRVPEIKVHIHECDTGPRLPGQVYGEVGGNRRDTRATFGADEDERFARYLLDA